MLITSMQKSIKKLKTNNLGDYHKLYIQNDTFLLADVFENFRINAAYEIYELDSAIFFVSNWISMASMFENGRNKIRFVD